MIVLHSVEVPVGSAWRISRDAQNQNLESENVEKPLSSSICMRQKEKCEGKTVPSSELSIDLKCIHRLKYGGQENVSSNNPLTSLNFFF